MHTPIIINITAQRPFTTFVSFADTQDTQRGMWTDIWCRNHISALSSVSFWYFGDSSVTRSYLDNSVFVCSLSELEVS